MLEKKTPNCTAQVGDLVRFLVRNPDRYSTGAHLVYWTSKDSMYAKLMGFEDNHVFSIKDLKIVS
jgi:hypothetical protein